jgi:hypothetical protein
LARAKFAAAQTVVAITTNSKFSRNPTTLIERLAPMREAQLSNTGIRIEVDVQELRILVAALNLLCNGENILDDLEERFSGTKDKAENLLISIRSLDALFDHLMILSDEPIQQPAEYRNATAADSFVITEIVTAEPGFTALVR